MQYIRGARSILLLGTVAYSLAGTNAFGVPSFGLPAYNYSSFDGFHHQFPLDVLEGETPLRRSRPNAFVRKQQEQAEKAAMCQDALNVLFTIVNYHYREMESPDEFVERGDRAYRNLFKHLELPKGVTPEMALAKLEEAERATGVLIRILAVADDKMYIDCNLPEQVKAFGGEKIEPQKAWDAFLNAYLSEMDPHSAVRSGEGARRTQELATGKTIGIGFALQKNEAGETVVVRVFQNSPAADAEIDAGDVLLGVDAGNGRTDTTETDLSGVIAAIRGPQGGAVQIEIRKATGQVRTLMVVRRPYQIEYADAMELENGILHLRLHSFGKGLTKQVASILAEYPDHRGLIMDLRFNGGGLLDEAAYLVDLFVDRGLVASAWDREGKLARSSVKFATASGEQSDAPLVILVNDLSASASEVVTQALSSQDFGRAVIVGRRTYGKGSVGIPLKLYGGRMLLLTRYLYYTQSGISPHVIGVQPDIEARDLYMEEIFAKREERARDGEEILPLVERDKPFRIPAVPQLAPEQREYVGGIVDTNPIGNLIGSLPLASLAAQGDLNDVEDPGVEVATRVLKMLSASCDSYKSDSCRVSPQVVGQLR